MPRQIVPGSFRHRLAQRVLTWLYGLSPDPRGWHFYPVRQPSVGAFVVCLYRDPQGQIHVGLSQRGGTVEHAGLYSVTFGGFVEITRSEGPRQGVCRETGEETDGLLILDPDRLELLFADLNDHEVKHWHADHATLACAHATWLTTEEYEKLQDCRSDETAAVIFVPLQEAATTWANKLAYDVERTAVATLAKKLL